MSRVIRRPVSEPIARFYRLLGIGALTHGEVDAALEHFLTALDVALAEGNMREAGVGRLHIAIAFALAGDPARAQPYFEQAVHHVASGEAGPVLVASVHQNFGEFCLEQGYSAAARKHLQIALAHHDSAGHFPALESSCHALLAEAALADGDRREAQRWAREAYKLSLVAENPLHEAEALSVYALSLVDDDDDAASEWAAAASDRLERIPENSQVLSRFTVARRCAEVRYRVAGDAGSRSDLEALRARAADMGLRVEVRRIGRILGG